MAIGVSENKVIVPLPTDIVSEKIFVEFSVCCFGDEHYKELSLPLHMIIL